MRNKTRKKKRIQELRQIQKLKRDRNKWLPVETSGFSPEYCAQLIAHCSEGFSFHSFAAEIKVMPEILDDWTEKYPEFARARSAAALQQEIFWERKAVEACKEKFSISVFRHFAGNSRDEKPALPDAIVILPQEESSK